MKIIALGDVHMALEQLGKMAAELAAADLLILLGDLTNFGGRREAARVVDAARSFCPNLLAVHGNLDLPQARDYLQSARVSLHGESRRIGDLGIFGCGGSNLTPFGTPLEYTDDQLWDTLNHAYSHVAHAPQHLMVCHTPPHATRVDRLTDGRPVGSPAVRRFILEKQPGLCLTGHIHEAPGIDFLGRTKILNAGPLAAGGYIAACYEDGKLDAELRSA